MSSLLLQVGVDVFDKFEALKSRPEESDVRQWQWVAAALVVAFLIFAVHAIWRGLSSSFRARFGVDDRRGVPAGLRRTLVELEEGATFSDPQGEWRDDSGKAVAEQVAFGLGDLKPGAALVLAWTLDGLRCLCTAQCMEVEGEKARIKVKSESTPLKGKVRVIVPESQGHMLLLECQVADGKSLVRELVERDRGLRSRIHRRHRVAVSLPAAASRRGTEAEEGVAMAVRINDLSLDGIGVLSEGDIDRGQKLTLRTQLPGYLDPLTVRVEIAWVQRDLADLCRAGASVATGDLETRGLVADFMDGLEARDRT